MDVIKSIYEDVREWLKFAETKNAALLTFNGVVVFGVLDKIIDKISEPVIKTALIIGCSIIMISIVVNLISFSPLLNRIREAQSNVLNSSIGYHNLMFYGVIKDFSPQAYLDAINTKYDIPVDQKNLDFAIQVVTLSQITYSKLLFFNLGLCLTFIGFLIPLLACIIMFFVNI
ncbi:hypothetical protein ACFTSE_27260 [Bacillus cereus]|uniref:hypothetical protein n=1 Tax=Bacillus cereus group TaxID=86661 RepID=UPI0011C9DBAB|nr:hypothetical protein [Bacillus sp. AR8-1]HDW8003326.1 hypothetical protein [Bacillus cereus]TXR63945.1 hypothetical protein DN400_29870 [Bacillus sp. AR8-1]TXR71830.1 hypothetical protein DN400_20285 [Bacillus sp. AR8-1]HDW8008953.1 hypothetical protein [Bacillus cereus]HDW8014054.1 hypothetical protein [Bacillus cereus]